MWPLSIAPFLVVVCPINYHKSSIVKQESDRLYSKIMAHDYSVLLDDRGERVGVMLAEWELIGIPIRILISTKLVEAGSIENFCRRSLETHTVGIDKCIDYIRSMSSKVSYLFRLFFRRFFCLRFFRLSRALADLKLGATPMIFLPIPPPCFSIDCMVLN